MKSMIVGFLTLVLGISTGVMSQESTTSPPAPAPLVREKNPTPPAGTDASVTPQRKKERPVTKSPVAKKYTSKKIRHGKDKVDEAKKKATAQPDSAGKK